MVELDADDVRMQDAAWWLVSRHAKEWGGLLADRLRAGLNSKTATAEERDALKKRLARLARAPGLSTWIVGELTAAGVSAETRMLLLEAMGNAGGQFAEPAWVQSLLTILEENDDTELAGKLIETLRKLPPVGTKDDAGRKLYKTLNEGLLASGRNIDLPGRGAGAGARGDSR